jgi:hypothetical protein
MRERAYVQGCRRREDASPDMAPGREKVIDLPSRQIYVRYTIPESRC